ncbi:MAG TPA: NAD-dependent epimerase/dehydratase family protein [Thermoanaerobaculia bacterium]|nr:NAD-dependent epimerase/dehydratase family protein [Thermoanaerobaculia bacterium]
MTRNVVTGGAGFIGSHLTEFLLGCGEEVVVWDDLSTGSMKNLEACMGKPGFTYVISDFISDPSFDNAVRDADCVHHLAAAVGVELILRSPVRTIETNIRGCERALSVASRYGKRFLLTSTSEVYGKTSSVPFSEEDDVTYGPTSKHRWSYGISKAVDEFLLLAYCDSPALPGVVARLFNTVGPRQVPYYGMVLPRFIQQAKRGGPLTVHGTGTQSRCFAHVSDVVRALHALMHTDAARGQVVNIGSDEEISILALAKSIVARINPSAEIRFIPYEEAFEPGFEDLERRVPNLEKARSLIGFAPSKSLDTIIDDILEHQRHSP